MAYMSVIMGMALLSGVAYLLLIGDVSSAVVAFGLFFLAFVIGAEADQLASALYKIARAITGTED